MSAKTLVVRRGLDSAYYFYLDIFAHENHLEVLVDRRVGERRIASESSPMNRRGDDRRRDGAESEPDLDLLHVIEG